ncbi:MAG: radical SAM protein [Planctomycetes bacterium]|nr:radical SAM protein [Planctomycetota bacterium]MBI3843850.1 radical SAM protein [Planctomycetota bacterium]
MSILRHVVSSLRFAAGARRPTSGPLKVVWEVLYPCNAKCQTCSRWEAPYDPRALSTEEGKVLIRQIAEIGAPTLSFTGGEPMLRPDLFELMTEAKRRGLTTTINTNGLLIDERRAKEMVATGVDGIYMSLDGADPATNDAMRGIPGYHAKVIRAIRNLKAARRGRKPRIYLNCTISRKNLSEVVGIAEIAEREGIDGFTVQPAMRFPGVRYDVDSDMNLSAADAPALRETLERLRRDHRRLVPLNRDYLGGVATYAESPNSLYALPCVAGYSFLQINPFGDVFPCPVEFASMGNVREKSLAEIWRSRQAQDVRDRVRNGDHPICWFDCIAPMSLFMSYMKPTRWHRLANVSLARHVVRRLGG